MVVVVTSPGRPEKLLRGKSKNRSRGRSSKSTPMFIMGRKCRNGRMSAMDIPNGKDPGSPKVTCIGKVTINKRAKKKKKLNSAGEKSERKKNREPCCRWFQGSSLFRNPFSTKKTSDTTIGTSKPPPQSPSIWRRWSSCQWSYRKNIPKEEEEENSENVVVPLDRFEWRCEEKVQRSIEETFVPATPPKNALLLMRCRSAPHWSSTLVSGNIIKETNPPPPVAIAGNVTAERIHEENDIYPDDVSNVASCGVSLKDEEDHGTTSFASRPLLLSRSNSGPAKLTHHVGLLDREDRDPMNELLQVAREGSNE